MKSSIRILVVDDNTDMRELVRDQLADLGCEEVVLAEDASVALGLLGNQVFNLLMTDQEMPGMLGTELVQYVRQELKLTLPIILMTSNADCQMVRVAKDVGANAFLLKPFEQEELRKAIQELCGGA